SDFSASQATTAGRPSTTPAAPGPRNCGQVWAVTLAAPKHRHEKNNARRFIKIISAESSDTSCERQRGQARLPNRELINVALDLCLKDFHRSLFEYRGSLSGQEGGL